MISKVQIGNTRLQVLGKISMGNSMMGCGG